MSSSDESRGGTNPGTRHGRRLLAGTLALAAVILTAVFAFSEPKVIWSRKVSEIGKRPRGETYLRVEGRLVRGSLCKVEGECEYRFRMTDAYSDAPPDPQRDLAVRYRSCHVPDTFRDVPGVDITIAVEGELCTGCPHLQATKLVAKCPAKYEMPQGGYPPALPIRTCP